MGKPGAPQWSIDFDQWAKEALDRGDLDTLFAFREKAPGMPYAHPTVEHFAPLFVTLGAAARPDDGTDLPRSRATPTGCRSDPSRPASETAGSGRTASSSARAEAVSDQRAWATVATPRGIARGVREDVDEPQVRRPRIDLDVHDALGGPFASASAIADASAGRCSPAPVRSPGSPLSTSMPTVMSRVESRGRRPRRPVAGRPRVRGSVRSDARTTPRSRRRHARRRATASARPCRRSGSGSGASAAAAGRSPRSRSTARRA